jgi:hypothetical protein
MTILSFVKVGSRLPLGNTLFERLFNPPRQFHKNGAREQRVVFPSTCQPFPP